MNWSLAIWNLAPAPQFSAIKSRSVTDRRSVFPLEDCNFNFRRRSASGMLLEGFALMISTASRSAL